MLTEYEAQKLKREMVKELGAGPAVFGACCAGLLIVGGLVLVSTLDNTSETADPPGAAARVRFERTERASVTEARQLLEARRANFAAGSPVHGDGTSIKVGMPESGDLDHLVLTRGSD